MKKIVLKTSEDDSNIGYVYLPNHPKETIPGLIKKTIAIAELISNYKGVPIFLDFDQNDELIGIEISG